MDFIPLHIPKVQAFPIYFLLDASESTKQNCSVSTIHYIKIKNRKGSSIFKRPQGGSTRLPVYKVDLTPINRPSKPNPPPTRRTGEVAAMIHLYNVHVHTSSACPNYHCSPDGMGFRSHFSTETGGRYILQERCV